VSTHELPQLTSPGPQPGWQTPELHTVPAAHGEPHAPQCCASLLRSMQTPEQLPFPSGQAQLPPTHVAPPSHELLHVPQCATSDCRSTQAPPHSVNPAAQVSAQAPFEQTSRGEHAASQSPQCSGSETSEAQPSAHTT